MLREGGLEVGPGRIADALRGLDAVDLARQDDVYWTLRQTLVSRREDLETFDRAFDAWFLRAAEPLRPARAERPPAGQRRKGGAPGPGPELDGGELEVGAWSARRAPAHDGLRRDDARRVRARAALIRQIAVARPRAAHPSAAPRPTGPRARRARRSSARRSRPAATR